MPFETASTFRFRNLGPIHDAELELRNLTIIAGRNNTGKTYVTYSLYGFLKHWHAHWLESPLWGGRTWELQLSDLSRELRLATGRKEKELTITPVEQHTHLLNAAKWFSSWFSKGVLPSVFSDHSDAFEGATISLRVSDELRSLQISRFREQDAVGEHTVEWDGLNIVIHLDRSASQLGSKSQRARILRDYSRLLFGQFLPVPHILCTERFGISLFYRELDFTKNQLVNILQQYGDNSGQVGRLPYILLDKAASRYALPIKDNIDFTRSIVARKKDKGALHEKKLYNDIREMMDGYFRADEDAIRLISRRRKHARYSIPLYLASSSARGLSDLYFYLRHVAQPGQLVIIDEPESHLDTRNQIRLARLLARMANAGLRVLITTHSDYLLKELNNLVMISHDFEDRAGFAKQFGYTEDEFISPESVSAYLVESGTMTRCDVDQYGMEMPMFDETIADINTVSNQLAARMPNKMGA